VFWKKKKRIGAIPEKLAEWSVTQEEADQFKELSTRELGIQELLKQSTVLAGQLRRDRSAAWDGIIHRCNVPAEYIERLWLDVSTLKMWIGEKSQDDRNRVI
jgi:hypothetical protein